MSENYVTRGEITLMLKKWQRAELDTQQLWDWASHRFLSGDVDYDDSEESLSVAQEMLSMLDSLDMNFVLVEDVPIHLDFLATPIGAFDEGYRQWRRALDAIDYSSRHQRLRDDPIYAQFCK